MQGRTCVCCRFLFVCCCCCVCYYLVCFVALTKKLLSVKKCIYLLGALGTFFVVISLMTRHLTKAWLDPEVKLQTTPPSLGQRLWLISTKLCKTYLPGSSHGASRHAHLSTSGVIYFSPRQSWPITATVSHLPLVIIRRRTRLYNMHNEQPDQVRRRATVGLPVK